MKRSLSFALATLAGGFLNAQEVGIGTTTPSSRLDIQAPATYTFDLLRVLHGTNTYLVVKNDGKVGAGTPTPIARLHVANDGMIYAEGTYNSGDTVPDGARVAFFWNPRKSALRAGQVNAVYGDWDSIGAYSVAFGNNNVAASPYSFVGSGYQNIVREGVAWASVIGGGYYI